MANAGENAAERGLGDGAIAPLFARFAVPGIASLAFFSLQLMVNGMLLGRFAGAETLAAVNLTVPATGAMVSLCIVLNVGCQCVAGIKLGAGKGGEADDAMFTAFAATLAISCLWGGLLGFFPESFAAFLGASGGVLEKSAAYLEILALSFPATSLLFLANGGLRAQGRPVFAFSAMAVAALVNVSCAAAFVGAMGMGAAGAGYAALAASLAGLAVCLPPFFRRGAPLSVLRGRFRPRMCAQMLFNGSSEGLSELSSACAAFAFNWMMLRSAGSDGVAALTAVSSMSFAAVAFFIGLTDGGRAIISFNYGRRSRDRIVATLKLSACVLLLAGFALFSAALAFPELLASAFFSEADAKACALASRGAALFSAAFLAQGLNILASSYFTAIGDARTSIAISLLKGFVFLGIFLAALGFAFGTDGIWLSVPCAEFSTLAVSGFLMRRALLRLGRGEWANHV